MRLDDLKQKVCVYLVCIDGRGGGFKVVVRGGHDFDVILSHCGSFLVG